MAKACEDLFEGTERTIIGDAREEVRGLAYRSDRVQPGDMFFCIVGSDVDGHSFAQDAIDRGARTLVLERVPHLADSTTVTEVVVGDSRKAMACASAAFYDHPSCAFQLVGVTGTRGKTAVCRMVRHIVEANGKRCGTITADGACVAGACETLARITPEPPDLQRQFARMRDARCDVVAMEAGSHALDMRRPWGSRFAVTAFTGLSQERLEHHPTFEACFEAKAQLFSRSYPAARVISVDDAWGRELLRRCAAAEDRVVTTGFDTSAQVHPVSLEFDDAGASVVVEARGVRCGAHWPLASSSEVAQALVALGIGLQLGIPVEEAARALETLPCDAACEAKGRG